MRKIRNTMKKRQQILISWLLGTEANCFPTTGVSFLQIYHSYITSSEKTINLVLVSARSCCSMVAPWPPCNLVIGLGFRLE